MHFFHHYSVFFYADYSILYEELLVRAKKTQVVLHMLYIYDLQGVWLASLAHSLLVHTFHLCIYCMEGMVQRAGVLETSSFSALCAVLYTISMA